MEGAAGGGRQGKRKRWRRRSETWNNASVKKGKRATRRCRDWQARAPRDGGGDESSRRGGDDEESSRRGGHGGGG